MHGFGDAAALGAGLARANVHVHFVGNAVLSRIAAFVDVAVLAELAEQGLHTLLMTFFGGANEVVVGEAHPIPQGAKFCRNFVSKLLRGLAGSSGGALDFLPVFIRARQEIRVIPEHAMAARNGVAGNGRVRMADVGTGIDVIDRGRDVELFAHENENLYHKGHEGSTKDNRTRLLRAALVSFVVKLFCRAPPANKPASPLA